MRYNINALQNRIFCVFCKQRNGSVKIFRLSAIHEELHPVLKSVILQNHIVNFRNFSVLLKVYFIIIIVSIVSSLKQLLSAVPKEYTSENNLPTYSLVQVTVNENSANTFMFLQDTFSTLIFLKI